jgi:hypothetical protein
MFVHPDWGHLTLLFRMSTDKRLTATDGVNLFPYELALSALMGCLLRRSNACARELSTQENFTSKLLMSVSECIKIAMSSCAGKALASADTHQRGQGSIRTQ